MLRNIGEGVTVPEVAEDLIREGIARLREQARGEQTPSAAPLPANAKASRAVLTAAR